MNGSLECGLVFIRESLPRIYAVAELRTLSELSPSRWLVRRGFLEDSDSPVAIGVRGEACNVTDHAMPD